VRDPTGNKFNITTEETYSVVATEETTPGIFDAASSVLVTAADGGRATVFERLVRPRLAGANLLAVLYESAGTGFVGDLAEGRGECPRDARVIDVGETVRSTGDGRASGTWLGSSPVQTIERPDDLASVEREVERSLGEWATDEPPSFVYVDSLSPPLRSLDAPDVGDFLERITGTLHRYDAAGVVQVDADVHDHRTLEGLRRRVDASLDVVGGPDGGEVSVVDPGAAAWLAGGANDDIPPVDVVLDLLGAPERRALLAHLSAAGEATLTDLAEYVAGRPEVAVDDPERLEVSLYQIHLPKLVEAGAIGRSERGVDLRPPGEGLLGVLDVVRALERP
jgi:hypothetical protein